MKSNNLLFNFRQNNSGGSFRGPAVYVIIEAPDLKTACQRTEPYFSLCGGSGLYAEYDLCNCCPCCGHRWEKPWDDEGSSPQDLLEEINRNGLEYMNSVAFALIPEEEDIIIGDSEEKLNVIREFVSSRIKEKESVA